MGFLDDKLELEIVQVVALRRRGELESPVGHIEQSEVELLESEAGRHTGFELSPAIS